MPPRVRCGRRRARSAEVIPAFKRHAQASRRWSATIWDIVIAETAIKLGAVLVSDDAKLRQVVVEFSGAAVPSAHLA